MITGRWAKPKQNIDRRVQGTITVFLSLILMLVLSLLCTIIEGARVSTVKVFSERALTVAMDSALAKYYGPLWEEYHIFGYYFGNGGDEENKESLEKILSDYMSCSIKPGKSSGSTESKDVTDLYGITSCSMSVDDFTGLMDYEGELLIIEAVEYMKYREIGDVMEKLLGKLSLLEDSGKVSYVMEEKQKVEEELVKIDKEILKLMELYDGLKTSSKGIKLAKDGSLMTTAAFIKKICYGDVSMTSVGINHKEIFLVQKDNYVDPDSIFEDIHTNLECIAKTISWMESAQDNINALEAERDLKKATLDALKAKGNKTDEDKQQIKQIKKTIQDIDKAIQEKNKQIQEQRKKMEPLISAVKEDSSQISDLVEEITSLIDSAITSLNNIISRLKTAGPLLEQYEKLMISQKDTLSEDIYEGLEEDLQELKKYTGNQAGGYDFAGMKDILVNNQAVLAQTSQALDWAEEEMKKENFSYAGAYYTYAGETLRDYRIDGLTLDYSTLVYDKSSQKSPLDEVNNLIQSGLTDLIINNDTISKKELTITELLPSGIQALQDEQEDGSGFSSFFKNASIGDTNTGMADLFGSFGDSTLLEDVLEKGVNTLAEVLLHQAYLDEHFGKYQPAGADLKSQKPSVLAYEQEYLLAGKASDQENLEAVISKIITIRMLLDFISVIKDTGIRNEAKLMASALVGFTGLPVLVKITQVLLLLIWSFAEALLDTCALLMGKKIPILKKNVVLTLPEIFMINRDYLQRKASSLADSKELSLSYQEYLRIFLLMKGKKELAYRSMDLIQENIRLRYDADDFSMKDCLYGFDAKAEITFSSKFTAFTFLSNYLRDKAGYRYSVEASYSY